MDLARLGWNANWNTRFRPHAERGLGAARVCVEHKELYEISTEHGERGAVVSGKLRHEAAGPEAFPAVGDWVAVQLHGPDEPAVIHAILPRENKFSRKAAGRGTEEQVVAANLDTLFLVTSLNQDFNLRRLERYLTLTWAHGINPVILLTKLDLCPDPERLLAEVDAVAFDTPVHAISALTGDGLGALTRYLQEGSTVALLGSSGVGKSTLVNRLLGEEVLEVREIRESDGRGRHTTTRRQLLLLPGGGVLIDTPGMRELQLWDGDAGLDTTFADVAALAEQCAFRDCSHQSEPNCAVQQALKEGRLAAERFENYRKMEKEVRYLEVRQDARLQREQKKEWAKIHARMKKANRNRDGR
jgi:ribosome biogenesis GTPase / thiamine phosphate phosphatase